MQVPARPSPSLAPPTAQPPSQERHAAAASEQPHLLLLLSVGEQLYALESERVVEVIPRVMLRPVSGAPPHRPGVFNFRGRVVPVVDVSQLIAGRPCTAHLSSRIIMVRHGEANGEANGEPGLLGLLAERVTDTLLKPRSSFQPAEGAAELRPFLGGVALDERGLIQLLHTDALAQAAMASAAPMAEADAGR